MTLQLKSNLAAIGWKLFSLVEIFSLNIMHLCEYYCYKINRYSALALHSIC